MNRLPIFNCYGSQRKRPATSLSTKLIADPSSTSKYAFNRNRQYHKFLVGRSISKKSMSLHDYLNLSPLLQNKKHCSSTSVKKQPNRKGKSQLVLDLGQKDFGIKSCPECLMEYHIGNLDDQDVHMRYHRNIVNGMDWLVNSLVELILIHGIFSPICHV